MDSSLLNADIHEFLACLGKHAVAKATQGFSNLHNEEPECSKMVFVEDTDELTHLNNRCSSLDRERKGVAFGGRQKNTHDSIAGWGAKKEASVHHEWKKQEDDSGWGDDPGGWETSTQKECNSGWGEDSPGGWGNSTRQDDNAGWGEETKVGSGKSTQKEDTCIGWRSSIQKNINSGWEEEKAVTADGWGEEKEVCFDGWGTSTQKEDTDTGWGTCTQKEDTDSGWGSSTQKEGKTGGNGWDSSKQKEGNSGWGEESEVAGDKWGKEKEVTHGGWGKETPKEDTGIGWSRSTQMESNAGWGEENDGTAGGWGKDKRVASGGWGKEENSARGWEKGIQKKDIRIGWRGSTQKEHNRGWGNKNEDGWGSKKKVSSGGWGKYTPKEDEWGSSTQKKGDAGWGEDNEVLADGWGGEKPVGREEGTQKRDACNEWGSGTQKEGDTGWGEDNVDGWGGEKTVGWGKGTPERDSCIGGGSSTQKEGDTGWGDDNEVLADGWGGQKTVGWGKGTPKRDACNEWGSGAQKDDAGWGEDNEGEKAVSGEKGTSKIDASVREGSNSQKEASARQVEENGVKKVASGRWGEGMKEKSSFIGWENSTQKEGDAGWGKEKEVTAGGWGVENNVSSDDWVEGTQKNNAHIGWESSTQIEGNVGWGEAEDGGWGLSSQQKVHDGWGEKEDDVGGGEKKKGICSRWETNTQEDYSGWDSVRYDPNGEAGKKDDNGWDCTHESDTWKTASAYSADGWGQKPLHKPQKGWSTNPTRTSRNVTDSTESGSADKRRTGTFGPSGSNTVPLGKRKSLKISNGDPEDGHDQSRSDWNSKTEHEALADSNGRGSEPLAGNNLQLDGWNDTKSDAEDVTPRPSKKPNHNSWTSSASNSQNRRPRLKALINLPECLELNRLYKATNKILHYSGYQPGDKLNPEDEKFILEDVLVHHREKDAKLGCGVDYVMIDSHVDHQVSCFWVVRKDGSKTDFSYWKCLENLFELRYSHVATKEVSGEASKGSWGRGAKSATPIKKMHSQVIEENDSKDGW